MSLRPIDKAESAQLRKYQPQSIQLDGQPVEVIDAAPDHPTSEVPVLYAPGWNPDATVLRQIMPELTKVGRRGIALCAPHGIGGKSNDPETRKAQAVLALIKEKNLSKVDAIGHSEAGLYLIEAALKEPEKFRSILLINPAGIIGKDSLPGLAARFVKSMVLDFSRRCQELVQKGKHQEHSRLMRHILKGGGPSLSPYAPKEVNALASRQVGDSLSTLREKGVHICIMRTKGDEAFPVTRSTLQPKDYDSLVEVEGAHDFPIIEPEKFIPLAIQALEKLVKDDLQKED